MKINKMVLVVMLLLTLSLFMYSVAALTVTPCEDEPDHFKDAEGNGYCIAEELLTQQGSPINSIT